MADPITILRDYLGSRPDVSLSGDLGHLLIETGIEDGFSIEVHAEADRWQVAFGPLWHEHFDASEDVVRCVLFGLTKQCRIKVVWRDASPVKSTLQYLENGKWRDDTATGLLVFAFWRPRRTSYFMNAVLDEVPELTYGSGFGGGG